MSQCVTKSHRRIEVGISIGESQATQRNIADASPGPERRFKDFLHSRLRRQVALATHRSRVLILDHRPSFFELTNEHRDPLQHVDRLEARHDKRDAVASGQVFVLFIAHDGTDMAGRQKPLHATAGSGQDSFDGRRHQHLGREQTKVGETQAPRLDRRHGIGRRGRLEPHSKAHDLAIRVRTGQRQRIQRRIHDTDVSPRSLHAEQISLRTRDAEHVAERAEDDPGNRGQCDRMIDQRHGCHTDRTARPVHQRHDIGQQLVQPESYNRMGLPPAHFHDRPGSRDNTLDSVG